MRSNMTQSSRLLATHEHMRSDTTHSSHLLVTHEHMHSDMAQSSHLLVTHEHMRSDMTQSSHLLVTHGRGPWIRKVQPGQGAAQRTQLLLPASHSRHGYQVALLQLCLMSHRCNVALEGAHVNNSAHTGTRTHTHMTAQCTHARLYTPGLAQTDFRTKY